MTTWQVIEGDCRTAMSAMPDASVDAVVTDPPYGLGFMGVAWDTIDGRTSGTVRRTDDDFDHTGGNHNPVDGFDAARTRGAENRRSQAWHEAWAREALRVLKPGGHLLAFGGTRTYHRLASGVEDAGFEIRDMVDWLYGSGFPKHASALKPAHEPIVLARKADRYSAPLNIDACRIAHDGTGVWGDAQNPELHASALGYQGGEVGAVSTRHEAGRWPANVILDEAAAAMLDEQAGELASGKLEPHHQRSTPRLGVTTYGDDPGDPASASAGREFGGDSGGASRFFYCAKPDSAERNVGLHERNPHPTVKPVELIRWLIRLVTPEGGTVLDPFTGSGTTGIAALREQRSVIGIEREAQYVAVARARIIGDAPLFNAAGEVAA